MNNTTAGRKAPDMNIVSVINQKGGVGKTTTTANLGACLAARGYRTLLIDMDPQANLTLGLGMSGNRLPHGLDSVLINPDEAPLSDVIRRAATDLPLYLAAGSVDLAACEKMLTPIIGSAYRLRRALELLVRNEPFNWVLID